MSMLLSNIIEQQWPTISTSCLRNGLIGLLLLIFLYRSACLLIKQYRLMIQVNKLPGICVPLSSFYLGNLSQVPLLNDHNLEHYFQIIEGMTKCFPSSFRIWLSFKPIIIIHKAKHAEKILSSNVILDKSSEYGMIRPWLNEGLISSNGNKWHKRRKLLTPAFHFNILEQFIPIINEQAHLLCTIIDQQSEQCEYLDIVPLITNTTLDVICETAMGVKINAQTNGNQQYVDAISRLSKTIIKRFLKPWLQNHYFFFNMTADGRRHRLDLDLVHSFTMKVIHQRKRDMINHKNDDMATEISDHFGLKPKRRLAFMDLLIEEHLKDPENFTENAIQEEVDTFMFAGHDTTAMSIIWTLYLLGNHNDVQDKVYQEIQTVQEQLDHCDPLMWTSKHIRQMKLLEACIKESLRLFPSVPFISRQADQDTEIEPGVVIPKNCTLFIFLHAIQRDVQYFDKPDRFIPDRFIEGSSHYAGRINPFAFVPFSAGARNCIGQKFALQEEKIILATLLSKFKVQSMNALGENLTQPELILRPKSKVNIRFECRKKID